MSDDRLRPVRMSRVRERLACAAVLSIGSHFGSYLLGPLKSSFKGMSESGFAALIESFYVLNTITPLVSGSLVTRLGSAKCALLATSIVLAGQVLVCLAAESNVLQMALGLFLFSAGVAPLAVVQESIMLASASDDPAPSSVSRAVAAGLFCGKAASFAASALAEPLRSFSPKAPFWAALLCCTFSFFAAVQYYRLDQCEASSSRHAPQPGDNSEKHHASIRESAHYGSPFWLYISICACAGAWYTFIHLSSSLSETLFKLNSKTAAADASLILFASIPLYPLLGYVLDKTPQLYSRIFVGLTASTAVSCLLLLTTLVPHYFGLVPAAIGIGGGPLLLVLAVPRVVDPEQAPTALGMHKSIEMASAAILQSMTAQVLNATDKTAGARVAVAILLLVLLAQVALAVVWTRKLDRSQQGSGVIYDVVPMEDLMNAESYLESPRLPAEVGEERGELEEQREAADAPLPVPAGSGTIYLALFVGCIGFAWVTFFFTLQSR